MTKESKEACSIFQTYCPTVSFSDRHIKLCFCSSPPFLLFLTVALRKNAGPQPLGRRGVASVETKTASVQHPGIYVCQAALQQVAGQI